jgi:hypothetical protein
MPSSVNSAPSAGSPVNVIVAADAAEPAHTNAATQAAACKLLNIALSLNGTA